MNSVVQATRIHFVVRNDTYTEEGFYIVVGIMWVKHCANVLGCKG